MVVVLPRVHCGAFPSELSGQLPELLFAGGRDPGWVLKVEELFIDFLGCVSDFNRGRYGSWDVSADEQEATVNIDFDDHLIQDGSTLISELTCHLLSLEDFTWELVVTNGTRMSVRNGVTVSSTLTAEVPSLHDTLITLTL